MKFIFKIIWLQYILQLQGKIVAPTKDQWPKDSASNLILISNVSSLSIDGSGGSIEGYGSSWWKCISCGRPTVCLFYLTFFFS